MKINFIELQGHGSYKNYTKVTFPLGITGIVGVYDDNPLKSNGSGKTTLVMAIIYALFGEGEFSKIDELVNDSLKNKEMFVKINFDLNGNNYLIERGRNGSSSYLDFFENDVKKGETSKIDDVQKEIINILGMDYDMFTSSVFFEQDEIDKFINVTPEKRRQYLNKVLGLELWRDTSKISQKRGNKLTDEKNNLDNLYDELKSKLETLSLEILNKKNIEDHIKQTSKCISDEKNKLKELLVLKSKISSIKEIGKTINELDESMKISNVELLEEEKKIQSLQEQLNAEKKAFNKLIPISLEDLTIKQEAVDEKIILKDNLQKKLNIITTAIVNCENLINIKLESRNKFEREGLCPECGQQITIEYISSRHNKLDDEINEYVSRKEKIVANHTMHENELSHLENEIIILSKEIKSLTEKDNTYNKDKSLIEERIKYLTSLLELAYKEKEKLSKSIQISKNKKDGLEKQLNIITSQVPPGIDNTMMVLEENISNLENKLNQLNIELGKLNEKETIKNSLEKELTNINTKIEEINIDVYAYKHLTNLFNEYAKLKFDNSISSIETLSNKIIHQVLPEISVTFYEDDTKLKRLIIGFNVNSVPRSYKRLSGGQKIISNIGLRLGFSKVIKARAKANIEFVVLDEPFGSLDENNRNLIHNMLVQMLQWFEQIIVISHVDSIKEFPNVVTVRMSSNNISYIE